MKLTNVTSSLLEAMDVSAVVETPTIGIERERSLTTIGYDTHVLDEESDPEEMIAHVGELMKSCTLLMAQQQICIAHACLCLGHRALSKKWMSKVVMSMNDLGGSSGITFDKYESELAIDVIAAMMRDIVAGGVSLTAVKKENLSSVDLTAFTEGHSENGRLLLHFSMEAIPKRFHGQAIKIFKQTTERARAQTTSQDRPCYYNDILNDIDVQITSNGVEGDTDGSLLAMNRRLDVVSGWVGSGSIALAKDLHRLGCLHSAFGTHEKCAKRLEESLHLIGIVCRAALKDDSD